jgi:hypothetical protein
MLSIQTRAAACAVAATFIAAGCGSSSSPTPSPSTSPSGGASGTSTGSGKTTAAGSGAGALSADAHSAATGDIPDNQIFLVYKDGAAGYSMKYPEGWTRSGSGNEVTFRDKNNLVHVVIVKGAAPTPASVAAELTAQKKKNPTIAFQAPTTMQAGANSVVKVRYTTQSAPNPVTGKRVTLMVDRYELAKGGRVATVDLGTPTGVDNVDAYRKMIESFTWR